MTLTSLLTVSSLLLIIMYFIGIHFAISFIIFIVTNSVYPENFKKNIFISLFWISSALIYLFKAIKE